MHAVIILQINNGGLKMCDQLHVFIINILTGVYIIAKLCMEACCLTGMYTHTCHYLYGIMNGY